MSVLYLRMASSMQWESDNISTLINDDDDDDDDDDDSNNNNSGIKEKK
jgi:hypothetical protein